MRIKEFNRYIRNNATAARSIPIPKVRKVPVREKTLSELVEDMKRRDRIQPYIFINKFRDIV